MENEDGASIGKRYYIVRLDSYSGDDSFVNCGIDDQDYIYVVILALDNHAEIIDSGYRSVEEAAKHWPEAIVPEE